MKNNIICIVIKINGLKISQGTVGESIPSGNRNHIFLKFEISREWGGLDKWAVFRKDGIDTVNAPLIKNMCRIPAAFMESPGILYVSAFAGDRLTVNAVEIEITPSGFEEGIPPEPDEPGNIYVKSPAGPGAVSELLWDEAGVLMVYADGAWNMAGGGGGESDYVLPVASGERLGGVKIGENMRIDEDGTISPAGAGIATEDEIAEMLDEVFGEN